MASELSDAYEYVCTKLSIKLMVWGRGEGRGEREGQMDGRERGRGRERKQNNRAREVMEMTN